MLNSIKSLYKENAFLQTLFFVLLVPQICFAQWDRHNSTTEIGPGSKQKQKQVSESRLDFVLDISFDASTASGASGNAGAEFDGTYFYTTRWASNLIHKYDTEGNLIEEFSIPGVSGLRDLAFDGTYMYGGAASTIIYQMDFNNKTLVGTIPSPVAVRFIAYDEDNDAFWCGNWADNPTLVSRNGTFLDSFSTGLTMQYGAAYKNDFTLWIFDQGLGPGYPQIISQWDIATGTATGVTIDVTADIPGTYGVAGGLFTTTGLYSNCFSMGGLLQGQPDMFFVYGDHWNWHIPCFVWPSDPNPVDGAADVSVYQPQLMWTNIGDTLVIGNELYFGTDPLNLNLVQSDTIASSWNISPSPLLSLTTYYWKVVEICSIGTTIYAPTWRFITEQDTNQVTLYFDDFESGTGNYTISTTGGCPWALIPISSRGYTLPPTAVGNALSADADLCGSGGGSSGTVLLNNPIDASLYESVSIEWDNDWQAISTSDFAYLDVSTDGGATWMNVVTFNDIDVRNTHEYHDISSMVGLHSFMLRLVSVQPGWDWWWAVDNLQIRGINIIPVELSSFSAASAEGKVILNWLTATETNNMGFEVERRLVSKQSAGGGYAAGSIWKNIGYIAGFGTTTEPKSYTFSDKDIKTGKYSYRLKQIDFDGSFKYSNEVNVEVNVPLQFSLTQNHPNPFNMTTQINYSIPLDQYVSMKVYNTLGQQVAELINGFVKAGTHRLLFDASDLASGVYFYQMKAGEFISSKKMLLLR